MPARATAIVCCFASLVPGSSHAQQTRPREHFQNADVVYDWVTHSRKDQLRTFISHPRNARFNVPVLFFVGWLSGDSVESRETDGFSALLLRLVDQSDYATVGMEKPAVGESQGCDKADFQGELEGYQAAFASMCKYEFLDPDRAIVIGLSNGGGFAPLVAKRHVVRAPGEGPLSGNGRHDPRLYLGEEVSRRNGHRHPDLGQLATGEGSSQLENGRNGQVKNNHWGGPGKAARWPAPQVNGLCPFPIGP